MRRSRYVFLSFPSSPARLSPQLMRYYLSHGLSPVTTGSGVTGLSGAQAAVMQFSHHMRCFEAWVPEQWEASAPPAASASYSAAAGALAPGDSWVRWAWLSRQHCVIAELLQLNLPR